MAHFFKDDAEWKRTTQPYIRDEDAWKQVQAAWIMSGGEWKKWWPAYCQGFSAFWVANDNQAKDDHFNLIVDGVTIYDIGASAAAQLRLGFNDYCGQLILPDDFASFAQADIEFPSPLTPAMNDFLASGANTRLMFSNNLPQPAPMTTYDIMLQNIQNNNNGNFGTLRMFHCYPDPVDGHPVMVGSFGSGTYSGYSGANIPFSFTTTSCFLPPT